MTSITLEKLKKDYERFKVKYSLPSFEEINSDFYIEKLQERESDFLVKRVRQEISDKLTRICGLVETMVNPQNVPIFMHSILANLSKEAKKAIERIYEKACRLEMRSIALDVSSTEKQEADFIKEMMAEWKIMQKDLNFMNSEIDKTWDVKKPEQSSKEDKRFIG